MSAEEIADYEVAFVGNLADYCIAIGSIPAIEMRGFWRSETGEVKGLLPSGVVDGTHGEEYPHVNRVIRHLRAYAGEVVSTEGVEIILLAGERTRAASRHYYAKPEKNYITIHEAARAAKRSVRTIWYWVEYGWIECIQDTYGDVLVERGSVVGAAEVVEVKKKLDAKKRYEQQNCTGEV